MDPALWELVRVGGPPDRDIEAIVRLTDPAARLPGLRIVARFGTIATCRIPVGRVVETREHDDVVSLKAPRLLGPEPALAPGDDPIVRASDRRRPLSLRRDGRGTVVGILDWGFAFANPAFRNADGRTRILALWDQRGEARHRHNRYGYGTIHLASRLNRALEARDPYVEIGYHPAESDPKALGAHGTHTADTAIGNGRAGGPTGIAPNADVVFVHLATESAFAHPLESLGDSVRVLEGIDLVRRIAAGRPFVVNASIGRHGGPHDGTTLIDLAIDALLHESPNAMCVHSAGNYSAKACHASVRVLPGDTAVWRLVIDARDTTANEIEIWYDGDASIAVQLENPAGDASPWIRLGDTVDIDRGDGRLMGRAYHRAHDPQNGANMVDVFLAGGVPAGEWRIRLRGESVPAGGVAAHAWIERDEGCSSCQARFHPDDASPAVTTSTLANGRGGISVGAVDGSTGSIAPFSSAGPSRDGRMKPDCVAPGVGILAAKSPWFHNPHTHALTRRNGTSMAAPQVAGCAALVLEAARGRLAPGELREIILSTADAPTGVTDPNRYGNGCLNIPAAVAEAERLARRRESSPARRFLHLTSEERPMNSRVAGDGLITSLDEVVRHERALPPDEVLRQVLERALGALGAMPATRMFRQARAGDDSLGANIAVVARPREAFSGTPAPGDVLVRRALGEGRLAHVAVVAGPELTRDQLAGAGLTAEDDGPGWFVQVIEGGFHPRGLADRFARRVRDAGMRGMPDQVLLRLVAPGEAATADAVSYARDWQSPSTVDPEEPLVERPSLLPDEEFADDDQPLQVSAESWVVPDDVRTAGEAQTISYDDAPDWDPTRCTGALTIGCSDLGRFLRASFNGISSIGGYACRQNTASTRKMSLHGTGRALDVMIPRIRGGANSSVGDPIAGWLVRNATAIGVQYLIWNRVQWSGRRARFSRYGGPNPHTDHIHAELNLAGASRRTPWFADAVVQSVLGASASTSVASPRAAGRGATTATAPSSERVRFAQRVLNAIAGERLEDDGDLGPATRGALERFRQRNSLGAGGELDPRTELALVQRALEEIDRQSLFAEPGVRDARTDEQLIEFKSRRGLNADSTIDARTRSAIVDALVHQAAPPAVAPPVGAPGVPAAPGADWTRVDADRRMGYVMHLLVSAHRYPVSGAAGIVGNLYAESQVIPNRVEGSRAATPMRAKDFDGTMTDFTPDDIVNRSVADRRGPRLPGVGLAQWTSRNRRSGLFQHTFNGRVLGAAILFDMDAQVDYLVQELATGYRNVDAVLRNANVTIDDASDEVVYNFEVPGALLDPNTRRKLPRGDPAVQAVFVERRAHSNRAFRAYQA